MDRCNDCGSVLPPGGECPMCVKRASESSSDSGSDRPDRSRSPDATARQSVTIEGSEVGGDITNEMRSELDGDYRPASQSVTVENSTIEGKITNRSGTRSVDVEELVETAVTQLQAERTILEEEASTVDTDDLLAQLVKRTGDDLGVETIRDFTKKLDPASGPGREADDRTTDPGVDSVPIAQTLAALTEVERLAASGSPDLESLYISIEKVVRLLSELDAPISDELETFVERQRALTGGSIYEETLDDPTQKTLQTLCDRARETIVRTHLEGGYPNE